MAKQLKKSSKNSVASAAPISVDDATERVERERKQLLANMASRIVGTVMADPSPKTDSPEALAEVAVDIAEAILQRVGL